MFFEDGIQIISPWVKGMNQWNMFYLWGNYKNYIYISIAQTIYCWLISGSFL